MKQIINRLVFGSQVAVVMFALLALVVSGAGAAARLFDDPADAVAATTDVAEEIQLPLNATFDHKPDPDETPGEMATDGRPCTEQAAFLQANWVLLGDGPTSRLGSDSGPSVESVFCRSAADRSNLVSASPTLVDHRLGLRFTLLGLKPSGTS